MSQRSELTDGDRIGDWIVTSSKALGRGGQGAVWSVKPAATRRTPPRAIKVCFATDERDRGRFVREIELMSKCSSVLIPAIFASDATWIDRVNGAPPFAYYVTEKYEGSLEQRQQGLGSAINRLSLFRDACNAVSYLHTRPEPIIHRDIKPPNFLLAKEHERLVLADFGIARELVESLLTATPEVVGTELFRAPEIARGGEGSVQSDVYSLGRVLEWLLTHEVSRTMGTRRVPRGGELSDEACDALDRVLVKATQPHPSDRFAAVRELSDQLPELWLAPKPRASTEPVIATDDTQTVWHTALDLARANDQVRWRQLELQLRRALPGSMARWRAQADAKFRTAEKAEKTLFELIDQLVETVSPRFALALAGAYSQHPTLSDQRRLPEELTTIPDWNSAGYNVLGAAPRGLVYLFHYVHGAMCCELGRMDLAMQMAEAHVATSRDEPVALWRHRDLATWPEMFGGDCLLAWKYLDTFPDRMKLLSDIFPLRRDFNVGLASYSMLLSLIEAAHSADLDALKTGEKVHVEVMPLFWKAPTDIVHAAFARTFGNRDVAKLAAQRANKSYETLKAFWPEWRTGLLGWRAELFRHGFYRASDVVLGDMA